MAGKNNCVNQLNPLVLMAYANQVELQMLNYVLPF